MTADSPARKPSRPLFNLAMALIFALALWLFTYTPDRPIAHIKPGSSAAPEFAVQIIRPRMGLPLGGILPPKIFGLESHIGFDSTNSGATMRREGDTIVFSADDWELNLVLDSQGRVSPQTSVSFELMFEESLRKVRCKPADPVVGEFSEIQLAGAGALSGHFEVELTHCEDAGTGKPLGWPPKPFLLRGSFDQLPKPKSLKVICWNVLYGFNHHKSVESTQRWLAEQAPEVIAFQELNGINQDRLTEIAAAWGHGFAATHKESGFPVGLSSKQPIEVIERQHEGFHHGFLHAKTYGIHFFVVHFWPGKPFDVEQILKRATPLLEQGERVVILGDFNGCSRRDEEFLIANATLRERDFTFVDMVEAKGFVDVVHQHDADALITCPSPLTIPRWSADLDELRKKQYRIDFIFTDPVLAARSKQASVSFTEHLGTLSDHYPVWVELELPAEQ